MSEHPGRVLAIDYGAKRVGVAVSDPMRVIPREVGTLENDGQLVRRVGDIAREEGAVLIVVGMPYAPDGGKGETARAVDAFIGMLRQAIPLPVETWDESYTSQDARRAFIAGGMKRKQRRQKERVDAMAARLLLQDYLENHHR